MTTGWGDDLAAWWVAEIADDPAYRDEVMPLALDLMDPRAGQRWLDMGCGEGTLIRTLAKSGVRAVGCDLSPALAARAAEAAPTVVARLPSLEFILDASVDGAAAVLVVEHIEDDAVLLSEAARVVRPGGALVFVINHPTFTAPGSGPFVDSDDELLWRWGSYLERGSSTEKAGSDTPSITFHHRPMGEMLTTAARAGWALQRMVELPAGERRRREDPVLAAQAHVPRLLGVRWLRA